MCFASIKRLFGGGDQSLDIPTGSDIIPEMNVSHIDSVVHIALDKLNIPFAERPDIWVIGILDTKSMDGILDYGHQAVLIAGKTPEDQQRLVDFLKVGDIVVYQVYPDRYDTGYAIHAISRIGQDVHGRYFRCKGANPKTNPVEDSWVIRDSMIKWLCCVMIR